MEWTPEQVEEVIKHYKPDICENCDGVGGWDLVDEDGEAMDYIICSNCKGKGKISGKDQCPKCKNDLIPSEIEDGECIGCGATFESRAWLPEDWE